MLQAIYARHLAEHPGEAEREARIRSFELVHGNIVRGNIVHDLIA